MHGWVRPGIDRTCSVERCEHGWQFGRSGGEVADAVAVRVMDRVDDRRARAADAELAKPLAAERAAVRFGLIEKYRVDRAEIRVHHDMVARQVLVDERAEALVDVILLHQRAADAPDHPTDHLRARGFWIENTAGRKHAEHAPNADLPGIPIHSDLGEMCAEGVVGVAVIELRRRDRSLRFRDPGGEAGFELAACGN